jgi:formylglycine-generating enzyme required for sulfatase activity
MLPEEYRWIAVQFEPEGDAPALLEVARLLERDGHLDGAATVYDRAHGIEPGDETIRRERARLLDRLAVVEHGLRFRYVPGGMFLMGGERGEPDEAPWHPIWVSPFWLAEVPLSWAAYCRLMGWQAPPVGLPSEHGERFAAHDHEAFGQYGALKIRLQYCEDHTLRARDWHSHAPGQQWQSGGQTQTAQELFGAPQRDDPDAAWEYDGKPLVAVSWQEAMRLGERLSGKGVRYTLPTEAQWEKAARGGLIGCRYPWGDEPPTAERCDFDRFREFAVRPSRTFPPNGYGLYAMCGGVWEWVRDWYDRDYYKTAPDADPEGPASGEEKVLRGGSWADCADAVTVTFRASRRSDAPGERFWGAHMTPTLGFRLCREVVGTGW